MNAPPSGTETWPPTRSAQAGGSNVQDGQIAAVALAHGMSVATRNVGDFEATGVALVNPWE